jgi:hypothetical protein
MFIPKDTFRNLVKMVKEPKETVYCNDCKYQKGCIDNKVISLVTYPNGQKGYAKTGITHYFDNNCGFPKGKY